MLGRILVLSLVLAVVGCSYHRKDPVPPTERTVAYMKIHAELPTGLEQVGWMEKRESVDEAGIRSVVSFVKNMDFDIRGYIRSEGEAVKYLDHSRYETGALGMDRQYKDLEKAPRDHLVRQILDLPIDAPVSFTPARVSDVRKTKPST
jgi:hypothetical protein